MLFSVPLKYIIHSIFDGFLGYILFLTIRNYAIVHICKSFSRIARHGISISSIFLGVPDCSHGQWMRVSVTPHLTTSSLVCPSDGCKWYLLVVLICSFQITDEVGPVSMFMDHIHFLFYDVPAHVYCPFFFWLVCFFLINL